MNVRLQLPQGNMGDMGCSSLDFAELFFNYVSVIFINRISFLKGKDQCGVAPFTGWMLL